MKIFLVIYLITIAIYLIGFIHASQVFAQASCKGQKIKTWQGTRFTAYLYLVLLGAVPLFNCLVGFYVLGHAEELARANIEEE